jgi:hypothetical protein
MPDIVNQARNQTQGARKHKDGDYMLRIIAR